MVKRVNVTLSDDHYEVLKAYSFVVGRTPTRLVGDLIEEFIPAFSAMVEAAQSVENDKNSALLKYQELLLDSMKNAVTISSELHGEISKNVNG